MGSSDMPDRELSDSRQRVNSDGECALCGQRTKLIGSHVLPAFVFRWLKETGATGYLRSTTNPKKRVQDGLKFPWLCAPCDGRFGSYEGAFAAKIFHPYCADSSSRYRYDGWLLKFCVSVSWRVLKLGLRTNGLKGFSEQQRSEASKALERWRAFLFDEIPHPGIYTQHLLPMGPIESTTVRDLPNTMNRYLMRAIAMDLCHGERTAFTYAKLGRFAIFGMIVPTASKWEGTRVAVRTGVVQPSKYVVPRELGTYLAECAQKYGDAANSIPSHQQDRIEADAMRDTERFRGSDQLQAMLHDERMFGTEALLWKAPKG